MKIKGMWLAVLLTILGIASVPFIQPPWLLSLILIPFSVVLYHIRDTRYPSISIIILAALYGAGVLPAFVFGCTLAIVVIGEAAFRAPEQGRPSFLYLIIAAAGSSVLAMLYLNRFEPLVLLMGLLAGALLRSALKKRRDALMVETLGVAMTMLLFTEINFPVEVVHLSVAALIALAFGYFSYRLKAADLSGLFSGMIIGIVLIVFANLRWFIIMLTFFIIGTACTRYRIDYKVSLGVEEGHGGVRGYRNVFANGIVAAAGAVLYGITGNPAFTALFLGSVASAAADTIASEIGVTGGVPCLITTLEPVPAGTNGGVTVTGEVAGCAAAGVIGAAAYLVGVANPVMAVVTVIAGFAGTNVDSIVGATMENRGIVGNAGTNLIATFSGGVGAALLYLYL